MTRYLVTGGSGFIGSALVRRLVAAGHKVRSFDNNFRGTEAALSEVMGKIEVQTGDIRDANAVKRAVDGVDSVIHLAYVNGTEFFYKNPDLVLDVAVRGLLNVMDACRDLRVRELIMASSSEVYQTPPKVPTDETAPLIVPDISNPRYSYGGGKILWELMGLHYGKSHFDRVVIFRPHNVYGPRMGWEHVIPQFTLRAVDAAKKTPSGPVPFPIQGDGSQTRSFIYIDDFIDGVMTLVDKGEHLNIYHIGNPEEIRIGDVAKKVMAHLGREIKLQPGPLPEGSTPRRVPDISKISKLGFKPKTPFAAGLPPTADWYVKNEAARPKKDNAHA
jgi:dTDP-glucose 4,6-dehydratase/UDP-glucose 4-epimerase